MANKKILITSTDKDTVQSDIHVLLVGTQMVQPISKTVGKLLIKLNKQQQTLTSSAEAGKLFLKR